MKVVRIYTGADNQTHFEDLPWRRLRHYRRRSVQVRSA